MSTLQGGRLREAIRAVIEPLLDRDRFEVFLFGSEAIGSGTPRSDIDIGILGSEPVPTATMRQIREQLETLRTLRTFDVIDFARVDESFKTLAMRHVERF